MAEPIPFRTGRELSTDAFHVMDPGATVANFTVQEQAAKNRTWALIDSTNGANLPANPYRAAVTVDNTQGGAVAWLINNAGDNPAYTLGWVSVPVGSSATFSRENLLSGTGVMSVMLDSIAGTTVVSELSFS